MGGYIGRMRRYTTDEPTEEARANITIYGKIGGLLTVVAAVLVFAIGGGIFGVLAVAAALRAATRTADELQREVYKLQSVKNELVRKVYKLESEINELERKDDKLQSYNRMRRYMTDEPTEEVRASITIYGKVGGLLTLVAAALVLAIGGSIFGVLAVAAALGAATRTVDKLQRKVFILQYENNKLEWKVYELESEIAHERRSGFLSEVAGKAGEAVGAFVDHAGAAFRATAGACLGSSMATGGTN